jgi:hypothetical protein
VLECSVAPPRNHQEHNFVVSAAARRAECYAEVRASAQALSFAAPQLGIRRRLARGKEAHRELRQHARNVRLHQQRGFAHFFFWKKCGDKKCGQKKKSPFFFVAVEQKMWVVHVRCSTQYAALQKGRLKIP